MRLRQKRWLLAAAVVALLLFFALRRASYREPSYGGKPFSVWFRECEKAPGFWEDEPSTKAIREMGAAIVPQLAAWVGRDDPWWVGYYWRHYPNYPKGLQRLLPAPRKPDLRQPTAAKLLFEIGLPSREAVPDMIAAYDRAYQRRYHFLVGAAVDWAGQLTNPPTAALAAGASPPDAYGLRDWILMTLARNGGDNKQVAPLVLAAIHEREISFKVAATNGMSDNTNLAPAVLLAEPAALAALRDSSPGVRAAAAEMLGLIAADRPDVIPNLIQAAEDADPSVRISAQQALVRSHADLQTLLPMLGRQSAEPDPAIAHFAMMLLFKSAGGMAKTMPALTDALGSTNAAVRLGAAQVLRRFGPRAKVAIPKLRELTQSTNEPNEQVRAEAAETLKKIAPEKLSLKQTD